MKHGIESESSEFYNVRETYKVDDFTPK